MSGFLELTGSTELRRALEELVEAGRRSVAAYAAAEGVVRDHRLQAALVQLRRDHERHAQELASILEQAGAEAATGARAAIQSAGKTDIDTDAGVGEVAGTAPDPGTPATARDGGRVEGPVAEAVARGEADAGVLLRAVVRVESELRLAYERHAERGYIEPIRTVLSRHRREEEAHEEWLRESGWSRELQRGEVDA